MNTKRFIISVIVAYVFVFAYEFVLHGILLQDMYTETAHLWRSEASMEEFFPWAIASQVWFVALIALIFTKNYEGKGIGEGVRYGLLIGLLIGGTLFGFYAYMPIPLNLAIAWAVGSVIETIGIGIVLSLTYSD